MTDTRRKNVSWSLAVNPDNSVPHHDAQLAVQMDIRDALLRIVSLLECHRIPRALDALHSLGVAARRKKRRARKAA